MTDKMFVVLDFGRGQIEIVPDWGDYAWGSARYTVVGYYETRAEARAAAEEWEDEIARGA